MWDKESTNPYRHPQQSSVQRSPEEPSPRTEAPANSGVRSSARPSLRSVGLDRASFAENQQESGKFPEDDLLVDSGGFEEDDASLREGEQPLVDSRALNQGEDEENYAHPEEASQENDDIGRELAQLSAAESVPDDMGSIALERSPAERMHNGGSADATRSTLLNGDFSQLTDAEIMLRAGAGDDACFEFLAAKYRRHIISFMYRMVHNQAIAEELAQEVFLRVYRARESYRAEARFTTWLYRIASNMAINHARDTKSERASPSVYLDQADEDTGVTPDVADMRPLAEQDLLRDERMRHIRNQVMALPDRQRMAVVMHKYQDMDYKQIGAVLKLSESATKSLLFRAYQTLRERLKDFA